MLNGVTTSQAWPLHPGDIVLAVEEAGFLRVLHRTPSEVEAEQLLKQLTAEGRRVVVLQAKGAL